MLPNYLQHIYIKNVARVSSSINMVEGVNPATNINLLTNSRINWLVENLGNIEIPIYDYDETETWAPANLSNFKLSQGYTRADGLTGIDCGYEWLINITPTYSGTNGIFEACNAITQRVFPNVANFELVHDNFNLPNLQYSSNGYALSYYPIEENRNIINGYLRRFNEGLGFAGGNEQAVGGMNTGYSTAGRDDWYDPNTHTYQPLMFDIYDLYMCGTFYLCNSDRTNEGYADPNKWLLGYVFTSWADDYQRRETSEHNGILSFPFLMSDPFSAGVNIKDWFDNLDAFEVIDEDGEESKPSNTTGTFDSTSDRSGSCLDILNALNTNSALSSGFVNCYEISRGQLSALGGVLWSDDFIDNIKKINNNPINNIISLHQLHLPAQNGTGDNIIIGNYDTEIASKRIINQFVGIDCGSISVKEYFANCLDYAPNTSISIYLPYVGIQSLNTQDVMNSIISVYYSVDILTGSCICNVNIKRKNLNSVVYHYAGQLNYSIPITAEDHSAKIQSIASSVVGGLGLVMGGASGALLASNALSNATSVALNKPTVQRSGSLGGDSGFMDIQTPYLIIERPVQSLAKTYKDYMGYPSNISGILSMFSGYLQTEYIDLSNLNYLYSEEVNELKQLFANGVIL